jgi:hypothetical protein
MMSTGHRSLAFYTFKTHAGGIIIVVFRQRRKSGLILPRINNQACVCCVYARIVIWYWHGSRSPKGISGRNFEYDMTSGFFPYIVQYFRVLLWELVAVRLIMVHMIPTNSQYRIEYNSTTWDAAEKPFDTFNWNILAFSACAHRTLIFIWTLWPVHTLVRPYGIT